MSCQLIVMIFALILLIVICIWNFIRLRKIKKYCTDEKEKWKAANAVIKISIQLVGGIIIIASLFFAWEELNQSRVQLEQSRKEFYQSQEIIKAGQISSRFSQAIILLSEEKTTSRIGAIYALEQIAKESPDDYLETVLDVLATFVRNFEYIKYQGKKKISDVMGKFSRMGKKKGGIRVESGGKFRIFDEIKLCPEIQVVLTVISRIRNKVVEIFKEDMRTKIHSFRINLSEATLINANLFKADLSKADLMESDLRGAKLLVAYLRGADLRRSKLVGTVFFKANLNGAILLFADLREAILRGTDLREADLSFADLRGADLREADLGGASLREADLNGAKGLEFTQLLKVRTLYKVKGLDSKLGARLAKAKPQLFEKPKRKLKK